MTAFADALELMDQPADLVLVGDGPQQGEARRIARARGICDRVSFLGLRSDLQETLATADLFCLASVEESFGLSALEAMASGTAVLSTRAGGVPEVLEDGVSGVLVDLDDQGGYSRELAGLLSDPGRTRAMGTAARRRAEQRFDRSEVVKRYEDLYRAVLEPGAPCP